jgi:hypothetical protein
LSHNHQSIRGQTPVHSRRRKMKKNYLVCALATLLSICLLTSIASAHAPSGAIFTTLVDGSEVNFNQYASKEEVYLDGGPGPGAPQHAAGLDDGRYVFQVTDPSGKNLLSTDPAANRRFDVVGGVISAVVPPGHATGFDVDHNAVTVQLFPFKDTPNNGGVYKVWVTRVEDYKGALNVVDPGYRAGSNVHGFVPSHSKTDNFKVKDTVIVEIDTRFFDNLTGEQLLGPGETWIDPLGGSNQKYAYHAPELLVYDEAHIEAVEQGVHTIIIKDGPGYFIDTITSPDGVVTDGPGTVQVRIPKERGSRNFFIYVWVDVVAP